MIRINNKKYPFQVYRETVSPEDLQKDLEKYSEFIEGKLQDLQKQLNNELDAIRARLDTLEDA